MALGDMNLFSWKSKEQREREQEEYNDWAFPYGAEQRANFEKLLSEIYTKRDLKFAMMAFLTCKELYERNLKKLKSSEAAVNFLLNEKHGYNNIIKKHEMPKCIALVLADKEVDESCVYPTADELLKRAAEIEILRK